MKMTIPLESLAILLDLPAGVEVTEVEVDGDAVDLTLAGEGWDKPKKGRGKKATAAERITADYTVDAHGHRTFNAFKLPDDRQDQPRDDAPDNPEDKE
ncbi:MAG: hypothetical protein LC798_05395 [Chloroflexi bacterium]|nr:hypothetical protein [Chloroflexota bacterium]